MGLQISIHAHQAESDCRSFCACFMSCYFNPRSPSGERQQVPMCDLFRLQFQSTLSKRRATNSVCVAANYSSSYFNPRSPSGERQTLSQNLANRNIISIHALQAESDTIPLEIDLKGIISIHALQAESDKDANSAINSTQKISIHALQAESDLLQLEQQLQHHLFQSTLSKRRATKI